MGTRVAADGAKAEFTALQARLSTEDSAIREVGGNNTYRAPRHDFLVNGANVVTMRNDKVVFHIDVDIAGTFNSISGDQTILQVEDPVVQLAAGLDTEADVAGAPTGVQIDTVPADDSSVSYMSRFKASDGSDLFVGGDGTIDVAKAAASGLFVKQVALQTNGGAKVAARRDAASRLNEPAWDIAGWSDPTRQGGSGSRRSGSRQRLRHGHARYR